MEILAQGRKRELLRCRRKSYRIAKCKAVAACSVRVHLLSSWLHQTVNAVVIKDRSLVLLDVPRVVQLHCINSPPITRSRPVYDHTFPERDCR